jgi:hypothetical protein
VLGRERSEREREMAWGEESAPTGPRDRVGRRLRDRSAARAE